MFPAVKNKTDKVPVLRTCMLQWEREQINKQKNMKNFSTAL